jgi:hydrogenase expression/formation protein HypC
MCLGVPGKVTRIDKDPQGMSMGRVDFSGITKEVCLAYVPEVKLGDYVIVHVGFAISIVDEEEAKVVFEYLKQANEFEGLERSAGSSEEPGS